MSSDMRPGNMAQDERGLAMSFRGLKAVLLACGGVGALIAATADANAGGFAVREQSAWGQGASYAGVAAGGSLSAMFWNPATMTQVPGIQTQSVLSGILPSSANTPSRGSRSCVWRHRQCRQGRAGAVRVIFPGNSGRTCGSACRSRAVRPIGHFPDFWAGHDYAGERQQPENL